MWDLGLLERRWQYRDDTCNGQEINDSASVADRYCSDVFWFYGPFFKTSKGAVFGSPLPWAQAGFMKEGIRNITTIDYTPAFSN